MRRKLIRQFIVGVAAGLMLIPLAPPPASAEVVEGVQWVPCEQDASALCGTLEVPVDWADPDGPTIDLALAKRPATDPEARRGSLVVNPGGPGGSGVDSALWAWYSDDLRRHFDIVGFDPRGVARSAPVRCALDKILGLPTGAITTAAAFDEMVAASRALADDCRTHSGPVFDHVDTLQVIQDIDAIRAAVGDAKLNFFGMSYGTLMAQQYAERYPDRVGAIVADSTMDHSQDARGFAVTQAATGQDTFNEFVAGCARLSECALYGRDIRQFWHRLLGRAERGELPDPDDPSYKITPRDLVNFVLGNLNYQPYWLAIASELERLAAGRPSGTSAAAARRSADDEPTVVDFAYQAVLCQDWNLKPRDFAEWQSILADAQLAAPDLPDPPRAATGAICLGWPTPVRNPQRPITPTNETKLLFVNSLHDPATGYNWALGAAAQFGTHAELLTYEGWGHIVYGRVACADEAIDRYLIDGVVPAAGTRCAAAPPPGTTGEQVRGRSAGPEAGPAPEEGAAPEMVPLRAEPGLPTWLR
ncbi:alpha/beta hydrolase [Micromonospora endophytica]|uniref:Transporter n=2 Tax=Micromonospora endophytica TaxID=515350 RepID=A0A2W2CQ67_9ACTN|nr:alpha/beta hydrolase [Micromonospora endophytica]PZG00713.1 transporter [Micromonospora endophytica]RIW44835.1 alpha/beta hydrolase [Micromonospora endophytica]BCJ57562.1 peptidase [Micromonospora endophytica]